MRKLLRYANALMTFLPEDLPDPEVTIADGDASFEWFVCRDQSLIVTVDSRGQITFSQLPSKRKGELSLSRGAADQIAEMVRETVRVEEPAP